MRRYILYSIAALLMLSSEVVASASLSFDGDNDPCRQFKMVIITPPSDIDFKIKIITPPKDIDRAMVINPCKWLEVVSQQIIFPRKETNTFFKMPPFTIKNKYSQ